MAGSQYPIISHGPGIPVSKSQEQIEAELRTATRRIPGKLLGGIFESPEAMAAMNNYMIRTHISWGISLAFTFVGLSYLLTWLHPPPLLIGAIFTPLGIGYMASQAFRWRRRPSPKTQPSA